jgi:F420-dependent oxidoreductase-like protein
MRIGVMATGLGVDDLVETARDLEARGLDTVWLPGVLGPDPIVVAALLGRATRRIEIGTAVVPTPPRHPVALAQQALTAGVACGGRFTLGIGLSHPIVIEGMYGLSSARPARQMREYLAVLAPLLRGEPANHEGELLRVNVSLDVPDAPRVPLLLAALGDRMLALAGRESAGTILWMAGFRTIAEHVVPKLHRAAREAGRPVPRVVAGFHVLLTSDPGPARERLSRSMEKYKQMPSYRAMMEREGTDASEAFGLIGDERALDTGLARLRDAGVTDLEALILRTDAETRLRTLDYLASRCRGRSDAETDA